MIWHTKLTSIDRIRSKLKIKISLRLTERLSPPMPIPLDSVGLSGAGDDLSTMSLTQIHVRSAAGTGPDVVQTIPLGDSINLRLLGRGGI